MWNPVANSSRRGRRSASLAVLVALILLAFTPALALADDASGSVWPVWGSATLQIGIVLVGGLMLASWRRSQELETMRVDSLRDQVTRLEVALAQTRELYVPRLEADARFSRMHESVRSHQAEVRREFSEVRVELQRSREEMQFLRDDTQKILTLLGADRG